MKEVPFVDLWPSSPAGPWSWTWRHEAFLNASFIVRGCNGFCSFKNSMSSVTGLVPSAVYRVTFFSPILMVTYFPEKVLLNNSSSSINDFGSVLILLCHFNNSWSNSVISPFSIFLACSASFAIYASKSFSSFSSFSFFFFSASFSFGSLFASSSFFYWSSSFLEISALSSPFLSSLPDIIFKGSSSFLSSYFSASSFFALGSAFFFSFASFSVMASSAFLGASAASSFFLSSFFSESSLFDLASSLTSSSGLSFFSFS